MIPENNLKMIAEALGRDGLRVLTNDITENMPRPCFHIQLTDSKISIHNQGTELEIKSYYKITYFASKAYLSAVQMQMKLIETLGRRINGSNYIIYPTEINYEIYPVDGILEATFAVYNWHTIGAGTEESGADIMESLYYNDDNIE